MNRWIMGLLLGSVVASGAGAAEEVFSKAVRPADFSAAGLGKLSAEELARLDALVRDYKSGALERARREAAAAEARAVKAESRAAAAVVAPKEAKPDTSLLGRAKVLLTPGTQVEYSTVESRLVGDFRGWEARTVFVLENGQRWQVTGAESLVWPPISNPAVKITPGMLGSFWLTVEGVRQRVKVEVVGSAK